MQCTYCKTDNIPTNQFCEKCGKPLPTNNNPREFLLSITFRLLVSLLGLWIIKSILTDLDFITDIKIPELPMEMSTIITSVILLITFFLLLRFTRILGSYWNASFPLFWEAGSVWTAILAIILLGISYKICKPILNAFTTDNTPMLLLQLTLLLITIIVLFRVGSIIYQAIPLWYSRLKEQWTVINKPQ